MQRRTFIKAAAAQAAAAALPTMTRLNIPDFGLTVDGQVVLLNMQAVLPGNGFFFSIPSNYALELLTVTYNFVAGAAVANRQPVMFATWQNGIIFAAITTSAIVALGTGLVTFGQGFGANLSSAGLFSVSIPKIILPPGCVVEFDVTNIQAADQVSNGSILGIAHPIV